MSEEISIGVHDSTFHSDDCLAVALIKMLPGHENAKVIRSSIPEILETCTYVCDIGYVYDHEKKRYDHHQPSHNMTFPGSSVRFCSAGFIYYHYGKDILRALASKKGVDIEKYIEDAYYYMYFNFVQEIDGIDNGYDSVPGVPEHNYYYNTHLSERIMLMVPRHTFDADILYAKFMKASALAGQEFIDSFDFFMDSIMINIDHIKYLYQTQRVLGGRVLVLDQDYRIHWILELLEKQNKSVPVDFVIFERPANNWRIKTIPFKGSFTFRVPLPFNGLRGEELSQKCGIKGGIFVHRTGFTGGFDTYEGAVAFAELAIRMHEQKHSEPDQ